MMQPLDVFEKLVRIDDACALSHFSLGRALFLERKYKQALKSFERCIDLDPDYMLAYLFAGQACEKSGAQKQAREIYQEGLKHANRLRDDKFIQQFKALAATF